MPRERDYAFEALAEVTASDPAVARGELNAALRDIRKQEPETSSPDRSYLLGAEIHDRAKMYRSVFPDIALTPTALSKHWKRVKEESRPRPAPPPPEPQPPQSTEVNREEARKLMEALWPST